MKTINQLGICMDHASAHLIDPSGDEETQQTIVCVLTSEQTEKLLNDKEQSTQAAYYKEIGDSIKRYDEIILFGPTNAKSELYNILNADARFDNIKIACRQSGKLTPHQQYEFVKEYFAVL
ncbi:MAG: hypothetical protein JWO58_2386 [Chitinophagaceae bacterium]|nr:hypothetical protein [Chitinophagaceae bacterium]